MLKWVIARYGSEWYSTFEPDIDPTVASPEEDTGQDSYGVRPTFAGSQTEF